VTHTTVSSSNLASVGYDLINRRLEIRFRNGRLYEYSRVPENIFSGLMNAASHGKYFDRHIKKAGYPYRRIR
jgi:hypothetical protein